MHTIICNCKNTFGVLMPAANPPTCTNLKSSKNASKYSTHKKYVSAQKQGRISLK